MASNEKERARLRWVEEMEGREKDEGRREEWVGSSGEWRVGSRE